jgi:putative ABC transport system substrate-binding protein
VIFVGGDRLAIAVKAATDAIPVVGIVADPVTSGLVPNLARPGGNFTGVSVDAGAEFRGKQLELLHEMLPAATRVAWLASAKIWEGQSAANFGAIGEVAQRLKISLLGPPLNAPIQEAEYRRVIVSMVEQGADALLVLDQPENLTNRRLIVKLAAEAKLPAMYGYPSFTEIGGLMAYGVDLADPLRYAAGQVDQILKGTKPGEIPFYQATKFQLVINMKAAKALGLAVPDSILARADAVIE